jgi:hypothetical protein
MATSGITGNSVGTTSGVLTAACPGRHYVRITNEHATATVAVNFGSAAALNSTNGSITLSGFNSGNNRIEFSHPPDSVINAIASGAATPVTVEEW